MQGVFRSVILLLSTRRFLSNTKNHVHDKLRCPSSSIFNIDNDNVFLYPVDMYDPENHSQQNASEIYKCQTVDSSYPTPHDCSFKSYCPVHQQTIIDAEELITWDVVNTNLCHFIESTSNENSSPDVNRIPVNIIIFGGSVTEGNLAFGCCCDPSINLSCPHTNQCAVENAKHYNSVYCRWSAYFENFIHYNYNNVDVSVFAYGGLTSELMSDRVLKVMKDSDIELKHSDIIFLDCSVNDAVALINGNVVSEDHLKLGLERLIRYIYYYAKNSRPTIILLEMWPVDNGYSSIYQSLADHYGLYLWSYRHAVNSEYSNIHLTQTVPYLRFQRNMHESHSFNHPPWHVHMYYADMISALFYNQINELGPYCRSLGTDMNNTLIVPPPLYKKHIKTCSIVHTPTISLNFLNKTVDDSTFRSFPEQSWVHYEDRPKKFGLISEFLDENTNNHILIIPLGDLSNIDMSVENIITLKFMRTYLNAGAVDVCICGEYVATIDALWENYKTYFISMTEKVTFILSPQLYQICNRQEIPEMSIEHIYRIERKDQPYKSNARTHQKFKLEGIELCPAMTVEEDVSFDR